MKRLLVILVLVAAGVGGLGFYRGWFQISTSSNDRREGVEITVDKEKVREDKEKAKEQLRQAGEEIQDKTRSTGEKSGR